MDLVPLTSVSAVDGRYRNSVAALAESVSEFALMRNRVYVEYEYLLALCDTKSLGIRPLSKAERERIRALADISIEDAQIVKAIETKGWRHIPATNHDVKAIEYFIKLKLADTSLSDVVEWVHFALTSEDVNSISYALSVRDALDTALLPALDRIREKLDLLANEHASLAMLARTHGQPATPTTFGKELRVFERRLARQLAQIRSQTILVKWGGASGNYNAHIAASPNTDWQGMAHALVSTINNGSTGIRLELNEFTTQIEPHDTFAEISDALKRINTILMDMSQDIWRYVSDGWIVQRPKEGEVGSSAMPHKVNPIDFENAEGNLGLANALFEFFARKLPVSRLQRDLSDSTVVRAFGTAFGHSLIAYKSLERGFGKVSPSEQAISAALSSHPEVLSEAIQTVLRKEGVETPYEKLKQLTRGKEMTLEILREFVASLDVPKPLKEKLLTLTPQMYTGIASALARR